MGWTGGRVLTSVVVFALASALLTHRPAGPVLAATSECVAADALLDAGKLVEANGAYQDALANAPTSTCATAGRKAATDLLAAEQLDKTGLAAEVSALIIEAVKARPQTPVPDYLRPKQRAIRAYDAALALNRGGYHDAAVSIVQQALTAYPGFPPSVVLNQQDAKDLADVRPSHRPLWQTEGWLGLQDLVVGLIALFLVMLLGYRLAGGAWRLLRGRRLLIQAFKTTGTDSSGGQGFAAVVGDYVSRLGSTEGVEGPDRVSKWGDPTSFPTELSSAIPQIGLINALITVVGRYLPHRDRTLNGLLHVDQSDTVGASVTIEDRFNQVGEDVAIWAGDFGLTVAGAARPSPPAGGHVPPSDRPELLYPLAYPVAVWAFWSIVKHPEKLGTDSWKSYALFGIGEEFDTLGNVEVANRAYLEALSLDPRNRPARLNLANLMLRNL